MRGRLNAVALALLALVGTAKAVDVRLQPQGPEVTRAVERALAELSTSALPLRLVTSGGPVVTLGPVAGAAAPTYLTGPVSSTGPATGPVAVAPAPVVGPPLNPDLVSRSTGEGTARRIEINPAGPLALDAAVRQALAREFGLGAWTVAEARLRFSGTDLNADGRVDVTDLALLMEALGSGGTGRGDLNGDGRVDDTDLRMFAEQYSAP